MPRVSACNHTKSSHEGPTALYSVDGEMCEHHLGPTSEASVTAFPVWFSQAPALRDLNHSAGAKHLFYFRCCNECIECLKQAVSIWPSGSPRSLADIMR